MARAAMRRANATKHADGVGLVAPRTAARLKERDACDGFRPLNANAWRMTPAFVRRLPHPDNC